MIMAQNTVLLMLAAGRSQRFGDADKLEQEYLGHPLAFHVVTALEGVPFRKRVAIVSGTRLDFAARGYEVIENEAPTEGLSRSIKLGVAAARARDAEAVLIALADMPRVTATHIYRLLDYADGLDTILASSDGVRPRPPALFGKNRFDWLMSLTGDRGAREMILKAHHVIAAANELFDVDTPEDLATLRAMV
ncbi:nucleotidyltransferase family protein [Hephaestia sp. GCM10023244]|uniref:nucleotidyltransferase family protein n=1 Tax=unclassified Hephaestia TaxID=2631281 RepID=UPI002076F1AB|nr:nucleotidyltransferase family protein [Hephaestia sp. MAHUQ-44]MCM8731914.1 nucleotidyltransferase family protein [Hephaestia sp. MAHUQ-44]